jgi:hypothetical protein
MRLSNEIYRVSQQLLKFECQISDFESYWLAKIDQNVS